MNPMPALTADELAALRASIERDGVKYPVLLDRDGEVIDGFHRKQICDELGIECPTVTLPVSGHDADRLRVALNVARRQFAHEAWCELVQTLARGHKEDIVKEAQAAKAEGGRRAGKGRPLGSARREQNLTKSRSGRDTLAARVNKDLANMGITKTVGGSTVDRILQTGSSSTVRSKSAPRKPAGPDPRTAAVNRSLRSIRELDAAKQYESMHNAPPAKLNLPFIRHAEQINRLLVEISGLDPETCITQIPVERCREWQAFDAEWWLRFTQLCEARRQAETPDVPPMRHRRNERLGLRDGETPTVEDQLSPQQAAVYAFLQGQDGPRLILEIANATSLGRSSVTGAVRQLIELGFVTKVADPAMNSAVYEAAS